MYFINTRPKDRAEELTLALSHYSVQVIDLPLLELTARPLSEELIHLYELLRNTQVLVVVSPTAVEIGMKYLAQLGIELDSLQYIRWVAVGDKTAACLKKYQIESFVPRVETSEGMLNLPILNQLNSGDRVAFWRGKGGRQFMMQQLLDRGIDVLNFVLYERRYPLQSNNNLHEITLLLQQEQTYIILISSEASWLNWLRLMQSDVTLLNKAQYWVLGDRLFQILHDYKKQNNFDFQIIKLINLRIESIVQHVIQLQGKL